MEQPLNPSIQQTPPKLNRAEKRMERHKTNITAFSLRKTSITNGMVSYNERKCTDGFCAAIFWLSIVAMLCVSIYCCAKGSLQELIAPTDGLHNICGYKAAAAYPNLFFANMEATNVTELFDSSICVQDCPSNNQRTNCVDSGGLLQQCPKSTYDTKKVGFLCLPTADSTSTYFQDLMTSDSGAGRYLEDMGHAWKPALCCLGIGIVYTVIFMYALAYCTTCMAFISIATIELVMVAGMATAAYYGVNGNPTEIGFYWANFGGLMVFWVLFNIVLCCCWKKVSLAIAVIDATADFMVSTFRLSLVSFGYSILTGIYLAFWLISAISVVSMNTIEADPDSYTGKKITFDSLYVGMLIFICVVWLWIVSFLLDQMSFIVMSSAAQYYFTSNSKQEGSAEVLTSIHLSNFKHAGSIAFGSGLHTLLIVFHAINEGLQNAAMESNNAAAKVIACLLSCWLRCLEAMIEWLTTLSYAMMAISGDGYCTSAWAGFILNLKHCVKFYMAVTIAKMFVTLGMLAVVVANCGTCYLLMSYAFPEAQQVSNLEGPIITIGVVTFLTCFVFMGPFNDAVIGTLLCFAVDMELNNGQPQFGPPSYQDKLKTITEDSRTYSVAQAQMYQPGVQVV